MSGRIMLPFIILLLGNILKGVLFYRTKYLADLS
jgi:hypothetical protein